MDDLDKFFETLKTLQAEKKLPPVHLWAPQHEGEIDIRIDSQGDWFHEGTLIKRQPLVNLFASILRFEAGEYFLVTPAEKMRVVVADVPFMAIDLDVRGQGENQGADTELLFTTNVGDYVVADKNHAITMREGRPYIEVRGGLCARLTRSVYYRLVDVALAQASGKETQAEVNQADTEEGALYVCSQGACFNLGQLT